MQITHITLVGYKPFLHSDLRSLEVDMTAPVQIVVGDNGSGKSSFCREFTPDPSTSSDYAKNGYKTIRLTHNNHTYVLSSTFKTNERAHSFLKDGEELNLSGTQSTQKQLVEEELGYTPIMNQLFSHKLRVSNMSKSERRNVFFSLYPSDLTFVAEHHKTVIQEIKACQANIKMLNNTKIDLDSRLILDTQLKRLEDSLQEYLDFSNDIDRHIFLFEKRLQELVQKPEYKDSPDMHVDMVGILSEARTLFKQILLLRQQYPELFTKDSISTALSVCELQQESTQLERNQLVSNIRELNDKIKEHEDIINSTAKEELAYIERQLEDKQKLLSEISIDFNIPTLSKQELMEIEDILIPRIQRELGELSGIRMWPTRALKDAKQRQLQWEYQLQDIERQHQQNRLRLEEANINYNRVVQILPKSGCLELCDLRHNFEHNRKLQKEHLERCRRIVDESKQQCESLRRKIDKLKDAIASRWSLGSSMRFLEETFTYNSWGKYVLNRLRLEYVINHNPSSLVNKLVQVLNSNKDRFFKLELEAEIENLRLKKKTIQDVSLPTTELISRSLITYQSQLTKTFDKLARLEKMLTKYDKKCRVLQHLLHIPEQIKQKQELLRRYLSYNEIATHVNIITEYLKIIRGIKHNLTISIGRLRNTISTQHDIKVRLYEGTIPDLARITKRKEGLERLEMALSPTRGLTQCYMVGYMNTLISNVNNIIGAVWSTDLKLKHLDVNADLDFTFLREGDRIGSINDISMCSDGQKEIIDLAFTLTMAEVQGTLGKYPLRFDEPDKGLTPGNRTRVLSLLSNLVKQGCISQLLLINHHDSLYSSFSNSEILCLSSENIILPPVYNTHARFR